MKQPQASIAIQVLPGGNGEQVLATVDRVIAFLKSTGLSLHVGPFETTVEGDYEQVMALIKPCFDICLEGAPNVMGYIKVMCNTEDGVWSIDKKITKHQ